MPGSQTLQNGPFPIQTALFNSANMVPTDSDSPNPNPAAGEIRGIPGPSVGYGLRIIPNPANPGPYPIKLFVDGIGNTGRNILTVTDASVFIGRFSKLQFSMPLDNPAVGGEYICQMITAPDGDINPDGSVSGITGKGGPVIANAYQLKADGTSPPPSLSTDGQAIMNKASFESFIGAVVGGTQISGGGLDIYRWENLTGNGWILFMQNIPVPVATHTDEAVGIPLDNFLLANTNDRWYVGVNPDNPITFSVGASTFINVYQRIQ